MFVLALPGLPALSGRSRVGGAKAWVCCSKKRSVFGVLGEFMSSIKTFLLMRLSISVINCSSMMFDASGEAGELFVECWKGMSSVVNEM